MLRYTSKINKTCNNRSCETTRRNNNRNNSNSNNNSDRNSNRNKANKSTRAKNNKTKKSIDFWKMNTPSNFLTLFDAEYIETTVKWVNKVWYITFSWKVMRTMHASELKRKLLIFCCFSFPYFFLSLYSLFFVWIYLLYFFFSK